MTNDSPRSLTYRSSELFVVSSIVGLLILSYVIVLYFSGGGFYAANLFALLAVVFLLVSSFELTVRTLIAVLFVNVIVMDFSSAVWFSLPLAFAFLLKHYNARWYEFRNPLTIPLLIYAVFIIPSFFNSPVPLINFLKLFNVLAFLIVIHVLVVGVRSYSDLRKLVAIYLVFVSANSIHVFIQEAVGQSRPFGFAGIMFVDYAGLGVCVTVAMAVISRGKRRLAYMCLSLFIGFALILTQTRNVWLSVLISLVLIISYLFFHTELSGFTRKRFVFAAIIVSIVMTGMIIIVFSMNPKVESRAADLTQRQGIGISKTGSIENSLGSRILIWTTALNAFDAHPFTGIGVYGFPYSSRKYSTIPDPLYESYVAGNSPHQTYLAVLAETGIFGVLGFVIFLFATLRYTFQTIKRASEQRGKKYAFVGVAAVIYCVVSMIFTDAWLWGQGIVLLGIVIGMVLVNRKLSIDLPIRVDG